jgi:segregation and condensation protein A
VERILEYKRFKEAAAMLEQREEADLRIYEKPAEDLSLYTRETDETLSLDLAAFVRAFESFLLRKRRVEEVHRTYDRAARQRMSVESRIEQLKALFRGKKQLRFRELLQGNESREQKVLTFLSLLELMKERVIRVQQKRAFGELSISVSEASAGEKGASAQ